MKIVRDLSNDENLNTTLFDLLSNFEENSNLLHYSEHKLRHPLAIYNRGALQFLNDYSRLVDFLIKDKDNLNLEEFNSRSVERYGLLRSIFSSFASFVDDTYIIFKCFFSINESSYKGKYNSRWVEKAAPQLFERYEKYKKDIDTLSTFIEINNELKHANGRMSTLTISTNYYGRVFGFFVDGLDDTGCIVPNIKFHKIYKNMRTAFSFNWFLYEILADFYFISEYSAKIIRQILTDKGVFIPSKKYIDITTTESIVKLIHSLESACTRFLYYDEYDSRPITQITLSNDALTIQKPANKTFFKRFSNLNTIPCYITLGTSGDGVSRTFGDVYIEHSF